MWRRRLLRACGAGLTMGLAGCALLDAPTSSQPDPEDFEQCNKLVVRIPTLPDPAREEAQIALNEGYYETESELYLPHVIALSESYLGQTGGDPQEDYSTLSEQDVEQHYRAVVTRDEDTNRLALKPAVPTWGSHTLIVENDTDGPQTAEIRIERLRDSKIVVDETLSIPADETTQTTPFDHVFGRYRVTVETDRFSGQDELRVAEHRRPRGRIVLRSTEMNLRPGGVLEPVFCKGVWEGQSETG